MTEAIKVRTYLDDVPEDKKAEISKIWGIRKRKTYPAAKKHGIKIEEGESFNRVVTFELNPGYYHLQSGIVSTKDISPEYSDVGILCAELMDKIISVERERGCTPLFASNVCDWDSAYAKGVGANVRLRDFVINSCIRHDIVLTGGETANLGDQVRQKGMSWMFTLLSRYDGPVTDSSRHAVSDMDLELYETFGYVADGENFEIVHVKDMPLLHIKKKTRFLMTNDGTGSKSIVDEKINKRADILDTLAMCCDDATREGAFPIVASIGVHAENSNGKSQIIDYMRKAGKDYLIPMVSCVFYVSDDVSTYIMSGAVLSEVREEASHVGKKIEPDLDLVVLYEEQRSNGITTQRRILSETFGDEWYKINAVDAFNLLNDKLQGKYSELALRLSNEKRTLGELVAQHSTPYFRVDSMMPKELLGKVKFRINVSSGGLTGKTRRLLEPFGLGANYSDVFEAPNLILLLQMASQLEGSKGVVTDEVADFTWGCGIGAVIGTTDPDSIIAYYNSNGIRAKIGGIVTSQPEIRIASRCLDSVLKSQPYVITHKYTDPPLG